jgi:predicted PurR-regulated permease PerM
MDCAQHHRNPAHPGAYVCCSGELAYFIALLIAIIIASAIRPYVLRLRRWRIPETMAILIVYLLIIGSFVLLLLLVLPPIVSQTVRYIDNDAQLSFRLIAAQQWLERTIRETTGTEITLFDPEEIRTAVSTLVSRISRTAPAAFGEVRRIHAIFDEIEQSLGAYVRGLMTVSVIVGVLNFIPMTVLRVSNSAAMAFIIGAATAIPVIGGLVGSAIATFFTLLVSPASAVVVLIVSTLVQQVENNYLTPKFMAESAGLDPLLTMVVVFAGFALNGIVGALVSIPIAGTVYILLKNLVIEPRKGKVTPQVVEGGILLSTTLASNDQN